jgi:hypothetical protein
MNRIRERSEEPDEKEVPYGDLVFVQTPLDVFRVAREVAHYIERRMDSVQPPRWLIFRDRDGARVRIRTKDIRSLHESTEKSRSSERRLIRAYRREKKADRSWEDEDK